MKQFILVLAIFCAICEASAKSNPARFLAFDEGEVMLIDLQDLPGDLKKDIQQIKASKKFGLHDLSRKIPSLLHHFGLDKYKAIRQGRYRALHRADAGENFTFSALELVFYKNDESKGDCGNYPDMYLSLTSRDLVLKDRNEYYLVVPPDANAVSNASEVPENITTGFKKIYIRSQGGGQDELSIVFSKTEGAYHFIAIEPDMGLTLRVFRCSKSGVCSEPGYVLDHPPCGS
jgi:hypothetical protein